MFYNSLFKYCSLSAIVFCLLSIGCIPSNTFEKNLPIKNHRWQADDIKGFVFDINDTTSQYLMYAMIRHTDGYNWNNIWLDVEMIKPDKTTTKQKVELPLAETTGRWTGKGMDEVYEHKIRLSGYPTTKFDQSGRYTIKLKQVMRENPLKEIMSIGIRLERIPSSQ